MTLPLLSSVLFLPLLGAIVLAGFPHERANALRWGALVVMLVTFAVSLALYPLFDSTLPGMQLSEQVPWMSSLGISYHIGVDGISLPLVLLTTFLSPIALLGAWQSIHTKVKEFAIFMLLLETAMLGAFLGWKVMLAIVFLSSLAGSLIGGAFIVLGGRGARHKLRHFHLHIREGLAHFGKKSPISVRSGSLSRSGIVVDTIGCYHLAE